MSAPAMEIPIPVKPGHAPGATEPLPADAVDLARVYVWQIPVRVAHWLIFLSIAVLSVTGVYIGHPFLVVPGEARFRFVMGTMRTVHFYAAIAFTLSVLSRVAWMFLGNRYASWRIFVPVEKRRLRGLWPTTKFYLFALRKPPGFVSHNPLAALAYLAVFFLYFVEIGTGLALYSVSSHGWMHAFSFLLPVLGGAQVARWIHHVVMWLLLGFVVHHIYSAVLMSQVEQNATLESIFSGYKFVPREDLVHSGYRFRPRKDAGG